RTLPRGGRVRPVVMASAPLDRPNSFRGPAPCSPAASQAETGQFSQVLAFFPGRGYNKRHYEGGFRPEKGIFAMKAKTNLTMLCDFYELTMANGYFQTGLKDRICYFDVFYRSVPDQGGFAIAAGLAQVVEYIQELSFD